MKKLVFILILFTSCDTVGSETEPDTIKYVVKDLSETNSLKEVSYTSGHTGFTSPPIVIYTNKNKWESVQEDFMKNLDAHISVINNPAKSTHLGVYIYQNGELVAKKESKSASGLSLKFLR